MIQRLIGLILILISLTGIAIAIIGSQLSYQILDALGLGMTDGLSLTSQTLDMVQETLLLTKDTAVTVSDGLVTVSQTADTLGTSLSETQPLLDQFSTIASDDFPASIEALQAAIPNIAQAAAIIDQTLTTLNNVRIDQTFPFVDYRFQWDLGINYTPTVPFDVSINEIGASLDGLPEQLRTLQLYISVTQDNLQTISNDIHAIADDLDAINSQIQQIPPLVDDYTATVIQINDSARRSRASLNTQLETARQLVTVVMIWLGVAQLAPFYLGWELLRGKR